VRVNLVIRPSKTLCLVLSGGRASHDSAVTPIYDDELHGVPTAISGRRGLRPGLIPSASLMTKAKGIDPKSRGLATKAIDGSQLTDYGLIDIVASTPFRDAFHIARPTIQKPVYVLRADHVAGREALKAILKKDRLPSAFRKQ
jgi:hypothetical protein